MAQMMKKQPTQWWWLDSHSTTKRSPWLQSTLNELNEKTKAMLKLIEEDADSFAQRAEMYYKKRPELVSMVQDFYRTHRLLAERYDQVKPDTGIRLLKDGGSPFASPKYQPEKMISFKDNGYDSCSENCDVEESVESEVDDPEQAEEEEERDTKFDNSTKEEEVQFVVASDETMRPRKEIERLGEENKSHKDQIKQKDTIYDEAMMLREEVEKLRKENKAQRDQLKQKDTICDEVMMLKDEIERLKKENRAQKDQLKQKDEEKIEVIRHLSLTIHVMKQENVKMRSFIAKEYTKKWKTPFEFNKIMEALSGKLFNGTRRNQTSVVAP